MEVGVKRTPLKRKTSLRPNSYAEAVARMRKPCGRKAASSPRKTLGEGRRTKEWRAAWRELKPRFERAGITRCEIRGPGCLGTQFLTPMHSLKRRNANTPELLREICIACVACHSAVELLHEPQMASLVRGVIAGREVSI